VLVETPAYLQLRRELGRQPFDLEIGVDDPNSPADVCRALGKHAANVRLLLGGFERYNACAHAAAHALGVTLVRDPRHRPFLPLDKSAQRALLTEREPAVLQPGYVSLPLDRVADLGRMIELRRLRYPLVVKPSDGGGGLGVFLVDGPADLAAALERIGATSNYGGGAFASIVAEEFIEGTEYSIQGIAYQGEATILTVCEKLIVRERPRTASGLAGFREAAHIAQPGTAAPEALHALTQRCITAMDYTTGPFHIDLIRSSGGDYFVEMGFRLSGTGVVGLVERTTGLRWAELVFDVHLDQHRPAAAPRRDIAVGIATLATDAELEFFHALRARGDAIEIMQFPTASAAPAGDQAQLASDRTRHGGFKDRVVVEAADPAFVRQQLTNGIRTRLENGACVD
jgi:biotin carboxylase